MQSPHYYELPIPTTVSVPRTQSRYIPLHTGLSFGSGSCPRPMHQHYHVWYVLCTPST